MNKFRIILGFLLAILFLGSCTKEEPPLNETPFNPMNLADLKIGDSFLYAYLKGESYHDEDNFDFEYTADTLEVTVVDMINDKYIIQEKIFPTSAIFQGNEKYLNKDSIYTNYWHIENDTLKVSDLDNQVIYSPLLSPAYNTTRMMFPLVDSPENKIKIKGWKTENSYGGGTYLQGFTTDFILLGNSYDRLNVEIRNPFTILDAIQGRTYVYSKKNGFIRVIRYTSWFDLGTAWDKI